MSKLIFLFCVIMLLGQFGFLDACAQVNERCNPFKFKLGDAILCCKGARCIWPEGVCRTAVSSKVDYGSLFDQL
nr:venom polypeptide precursor [Doratifera vulnerans]